MKKSILALPACVVLTTLVYADAVFVNGPMKFRPIAASAYEQTTSDPAILNSKPWVIPKGFTQHIISDESDLDIYPNSGDWTDMNTVNETGKHAGRYLYRTHEVRPGADPYLGGAVSVVDLKTGKAKILAQRADWEALDGLVWTPWRSILFAEETITAQFPDPDAPRAQSGMLYEMKFEKDAPTEVKEIKVRPMLGSLAHEGIEIDEEGNVYVIDEDRKGSIYKFVPDSYGDLSSGQLYALRVKNGMKVGQAEWVALDMSQAQINARLAAQAINATPFCRPEDLERIRNTLYAALTCEDATDPNNIDGPGAILAVKLGAVPKVSYFVQPGVNVPFEIKPTNITRGVTGFMRPDNLANGPDGKLWIVEDNDNSDIWVAVPDEDGDGYSDGVHLFASLKDKSAEGTGIYFGKDPHTLFVNIQHSETGNDKTIAITPKSHHKSRD